MLRFHSHSNVRVLERLADEGWRKEISSHREDYARCIAQVKGVNGTLPLTEGGTNAHIPEEYVIENRFQSGRR